MVLFFYFYMHTTVVCDGLINTDECVFQYILVCVKLAKIINKLALFIPCYALCWAWERQFPRYFVRSGSCDLMVGDSKRGHYKQNCLFFNHNLAFIKFLFWCVMKLLCQTSQHYSSVHLQHFLLYSNSVVAGAPASQFKQIHQAHNDHKVIELVIECD